MPKNKKCIDCGKLCYGKRCSKCHMRLNGLKRKGVKCSNETKVKMRIAKINYIPWNKGLTTDIESRLNYNRPTIFKKGNISHTTGKTKDNYQPLKIASNKLKNHSIYKSKERNKKISDKIKQRFKENPEKHPNRIMAQKGFVSKPQKELFKIIKQWFSDAEMEYPLTLEKSTVYGDIVVPNEKLWFEYDGDYWHQDKEKDIIRQKQIKEKGFNVIRINREQLDNIKEHVDVPLWRL